jgi:hypothetical protein
MLSPEANPKSLLDHLAVVVEVWAVWVEDTVAGWIWSRLGIRSQQQNARD